MTNVPATLRAASSATTRWSPLTQATVQTSRDGTRKLRFRTHDGRAIEAVLIPDEERTRSRSASRRRSAARSTASSARPRSSGFGRNLDAGEIVDQVYRATRARRAAARTNLVFMGMGEPLHNYDNVSRALRDPGSTRARASRRGASRCRRRAWCPGSRSSAREAARPTSRSRSTRRPTRCATRIMPINRKWPIAELLEARAPVPAGARPARHVRVRAARRRQRQRRRRRPPPAAAARHRRAR